MARISKTSWTLSNVKNLCGLAALVAAAGWAHAGPSVSPNDSADQPIQPQVNPDLNRDGQVNRQDYVAFIVTFTAGQLAADMNADRELNLDDIQLFASAYRSAVDNPAIDPSPWGEDQPESAAWHLLEALRRDHQPADVDTNGVIDVSDILAFGSAFYARADSADVTGEGEIDEKDVRRFIIAFEFPNDRPSGSYGEVDPIDPINDGRDDFDEDDPTNEPRVNGAASSHNTYGEDDPRADEPGGSSDRPNEPGEDDPTDGEPTDDFDRPDDFDHDDPTEPDGKPDLLDYFEALGKQSPAADYDQDGDLDRNDVRKFLEDWAKGAL